MIGHLKGATVRYEPLLADARKSTTGLRKEMLVASEIEFTDEDSFYTLCGGDDENGFEMWRSLRLQY